MAQPVSFKEQTTTLGPAKGTEEYVGSLPIHNDGYHCTSCWELSEEELEAVVKTGKVWLTVLSGRTQPPVMVSSTLPMHMMPSILAASPDFTVAHRWFVEHGATWVADGLYRMPNGQWAVVITDSEILKDAKGRTVVNLGLITDVEFLAWGLQGLDLR